MAVADDAVVVVAGTAVMALDPTTGEVRWEEVREPGPAGPPAIAGRLVIHASGLSSDATLEARRVEDGREEWTAALESQVHGGITVEGERAYVGSRGGRVIALETATGEEAWTFEAPDAVRAAPAVADGVVLAVSQNTTSGESALVALEAETGEERWRVPQEGAPVTVAGGPAAAEGLAFAGLADRAFHAIDLESGSERWAVRPRAPIPFSAFQIPAVSSGVLYGPDLLNVSSLDAASGEERWTYQLTDVIGRASPSVTGDVVVYGDRSGTVAAIDTDSGLLVWRGRVEPGPVGPVAVSPDRLYLSSGGEDGVVAALEHDPDGRLLAEQSPTVLLPGRALLNFAGAAVVVGGALFLLFRFALRPREARS
jgi:outer membrane protein assembly factor BamB